MSRGVVERLYRTRLDHRLVQVSQVVLEGHADAERVRTLLVLMRDRFRDAHEVVS